MLFGVLTLFDYYPEDTSPQDYSRLLLDEIAYAEELGFDSAWLGEHHFCNYLCSLPQVFAAAVGAVHLSIAYRHCHCSFAVA